MTSEQETNAADNSQQSASSAVRPLIICDPRTMGTFYAALRHMLFGLEARGIRSAVVLPPDSRIEKLLWPGITMIEYPALKLPFLYRHNRRRLFEQVEKFRPTVIHCMGTGRAGLSKALSRVFDIPAVVSLYNLRQNLIANLQLRSGFSAVIAPSNSLANRLKKANPRIAPLIRQINAGTFVDDTCVCFSNTDRIASIVTVCELRRFSDIEPLLNAVRHLAVDGYEFLLVLVGSGRAEGRIRRFIRAVGLSSSVSISPQVWPLRTVFRGVDIFVQPYAAEKFDPALIEAAAAGAAVSTDRANGDDFLQDNTTALFFDSTDELSIYAALQRLLDERDFARSVSMAAQDYLRGKNTVSDMVDKLADIYSQAVKSS